MTCLTYDVMYASHKLRKKVSNDFLTLVVRRQATAGNTSSVVISHLNTPKLDILAACGIKTILS